MSLAARINGASDVLAAPLDEAMRLNHKLVNVVIVAVLEAVCRLAYRSYASTDGKLSAPRSESQNTKRELRFRVLLGE